MSSDFARRGGWWVVAQSALLIAVVVLPCAARHQWTSAWSTVLGMVLLAIGAAVGIAGVHALGRNRTAFPKPVEQGTLIEHGIYRLIRHPLYTSVMLVSLGWALLWQSGPVIVVALILGALLDRKARREEAWLREKYPGYAAYEQRVRRFVPWVW